MSIVADDIAQSKHGVWFATNKHAGPYMNWMVSMGWFESCGEWDPSTLVSLFAGRINWYSLNILDSPVTSDDLYVLLGYLSAKRAIINLIDVHHSKALENSHRMYRSISYLVLWLLVFVLFQETFFMICFSCYVFHDILYMLSLYCYLCHVILLVQLLSLYSLVN